jgi:ABC-2 type transport system permease protein
VTDILTVARKELREIVGGGSGRKSLIREIFFVFLFGVFFPLSQSDAWRSGAVPTVFVFMIPLFLAGPYVADTFAGEKERKTLETLLATRLPDSSIYLGKILAVCTYAWAVTQLIVIASLVALNLAGGGASAGNGAAAGGAAFGAVASAAQVGGLFVYPAPVWVGALAGSYASALLIAGIGTFISLRSETVRAAHQAMMLPLFVLIFGGSFGLGALWRALPVETQVSVARWASGVSPMEAIVGIVATLLVVDLFLLRLGVRRFRRSKLISS